MSGSELATLRIARSVEGARFRSLAFCPIDPPDVRLMFESAGFRAIPYEAVAPQRKRLGSFLLASLRLARAFRHHDVDLVHCMDPAAGPHAAVAAKLAGRPVICHVRNRCERLPRIARLLLRAVDHFVFVSHETRRRFGLRVPAGKGRVIYDHPETNGLMGREGDATAHDVRREFGIPPTATLIGMVARVHQQKDHETLVRAAVRVVAAHPDVRFLMVGDHSRCAENRAHYQIVARLIEDLGLDGHFIFTGFRTDVYRLIGAMDLCVLSTHWEGLPLAAMEAMAQGKPLVATAVDGIPELVTDGQTGLLFPESNHERFAEQLLALMGDESLAARIGQAGRRCVQEQFRGDVHVEEYLRLYAEMLARGA